jgi:hypothetical protein
MTGVGDDGPNVGEREAQAAEPSTGAVVAAAMRFSA